MIDAQSSYGEELTTVRDVAEIINKGYIVTFIHDDKLYNRADYKVTETLIQHIDDDGKTDDFNYVTNNTLVTIVKMTEVENNDLRWVEIYDG